MKVKAAMTVAALVASIVGVGSMDSSNSDVVTSGPLSEYQRKCSQAIGAFLYAIPMLDRGQYSVSLGEAFRPESVAREYARKGKGIANSLHTQRLAIDLNLFVDGKFRTDSEAHRPLAELWLALAPKYGVEPAAGVNFSKPDGNHYSCKWQGVS